MVYLTLSDWLICCRRRRRGTASLATPVSTFSGRRRSRANSSVSSDHIISADEGSNSLPAATPSATASAIASATASATTSPPATPAQSINSSSVSSVSAPPTANIQTSDSSATTVFRFPKSKRVSHLQTYNKVEHFLDHGSIEM